MMMKNDMLAAIGRLKRRWDKRAFDQVTAAVLQTAPLPLHGDSPLFFSMVCHQDVTAYLLAIKSLYTRIGQGRVSIINDGSLTADDLATLRHHLPGLTVTDIQTVATGACPRGGTWERLVSILALSRDTYVIQADADTLTCTDIPEVAACWQQNRSFLLGTGSGQTIAPAPEAAAMVQGWIKTYGWQALPVGVAAEAALDQLPDPVSRSYVHASSGFAGFARGVFSLQDLEAFSRHMTGLLGADRWNLWGSEQIASNYILANAPNATVLPFPRYACFEPQLSDGGHAFLHFIGSYRYQRGVYRQEARRFLASMTQ